MLILASSSPRRRELLQAAGIEFVVQPADVPEIPGPDESPVDFAKRLAREKAESIGRAHPKDMVLGADTIVIVDGEIFGKPADPEDAARMLRRLSGRDHLVTTAVCLCRNGVADVHAETTRVFFSTISEAEIAEYIASGHPMDKAGAYGIQGYASRWVYRVEGDYFTIVGLPVARVWGMLERAGYGS